MAVTQVLADKAGFSNIAVKDVLGYYYLSFGSVRFYQGSGSPNGIITTTALCPIGSLYLDVAAAKLYIMTVTTGTWVVVGTQT